LPKRSRSRSEPVGGPPPTPAAIPIAVALAALIAFVVLAIGDITATSPTSDELPHLASGYTYLTLHDYRLNDEHPPLIKELAAASIVGEKLWRPSLQMAWNNALEVPNAQWSFAHQMFYERRPEYADTPTTERIPRSAFYVDSEKLFTRARLTMLLLPLLLGIVIFAWAGEVWGLWGGAVAAALYAFDPNFIAHGGLVTTDAGVAALMAAAIYFMWRVSRRPTPINIAAFSIFSGLTMVAKFSGLLLMPMIAVLFFHSRNRRMMMAIACAAAATIAIVWAAYGFRYRATAERPRPLVMVVNDWYAARSLLDQYPDGPPEIAIQRARSTVPIGLLGQTVLFASDLHLLPEPYLYGVALTERNSYARWSFLNGEGSHRGFPTYFLYTFFYKTPEAAIVLIVLGLVLMPKNRNSATPFLFWPIAIYMAVSMASSLNIGHRHILPVYPYLYVIAGSLWSALPWRRFLLGAACVLAAIPAVFFRGNHLAYMNLIAGGPSRGYDKLIDSNFDWGQDLKRLGEWAKNRTEPVNLAYFGTADPRFYGIPYYNLPYGYGMEPAVPPNLNVHDFVISASALKGVNADVEPARHYWEQFLAEHKAKLVGRAGYSILIYQLK
jgi:hypothetical protein